MSFETIGATEMIKGAGKPQGDGTRHGQTDAGTELASIKETAEWLAKHSPTVMDEAAISRASQHNVGLMVKYEGRYPEGPNGEKMPSYNVAVGCKVNGTDDDRKAALADLRNFQTPAPLRNIEAWIVELTALTAGRGREGVNASVTLNAYGSRLAQYPADVARYALLKHSWTWFPSWAELEAVCEAKAAPRRNMIAALSRPAPEPEPERRVATQEERERSAAYLAEQMPHIPNAQRQAAIDEALKGECFQKEP